MGKQTLVILKHNDHKRHGTCGDSDTERIVYLVTSETQNPPLSRGNRSTLSTKLKQVLIPRIVLVDDFRKVDVPGPRVGMRVRDVMHPGRIVPSNNRTIRVGGRDIFWRRLGSLLLRILRLLLLLLIWLPMLRDGGRRVDMEWGRWVKMGSRSSRKWCYGVREGLVIEQDGICRGGGMH